MLLRGVEERGLKRRQRWPSLEKRLAVEVLRMLPNRVLNVLAAYLGIVVIPLQLVTTAVGGLLVAVTCGLFLVALDAIWMGVFLGPLLGLSWLYDKAGPARVLVALIGVPVALTAGIYVALSPAMGEVEARREKLRLCWCWPFSVDYVHWGQGTLEDPCRLRRLSIVMHRVQV